MKIKKGDKVIVISGADKGKIGTVLHAHPKKDRILIEGVNVKKKHQRSTRGGQKGQIIEKSLPIHISNIMILDPKKNVGTRVGISREGGKMARISKKSGEVV